MCPCRLVVCRAFRREYKNADSPYNFRCDKDYYNDLPGKVPPDLLCDNDPNLGAVCASSCQGPPAQLNIRVSLATAIADCYLFNGLFALQRERINSNLIDLNSPTATNVEHDYVNGKLGQHVDSADNTSTSTATAVSTSSNSNFRDVFDMRTYPDGPPHPSAPTGS